MRCRFKQLLGECGQPRRRRIWWVMGEGGGLQDTNKEMQEGVGGGGAGMGTGARLRHLGPPCLRLIVVALRAPKCTRVIDTRAAAK